MNATILLGGNLGNRQAYLEFAKYLISKDVGRIIQKSSIFESEAWGEIANKSFLNQVLDVATNLNPLELLHKLLLIEKKAGRMRMEKWGNRSLDLDILFLEDLIINQEELTVPHPEIQNRMFVLKPLMELNADFVHPILKHSIRDLTANCSDGLKVKLYKTDHV